MGWAYLIIFSKLLCLKKSKEHRAEKNLISIPVNEAESEVLQHNFHIPSGLSDVSITSAHTNKIIGLREKQTFHYWSTGKE